MSFCEFACLKRNDFRRLLTQYPEMIDPMRKHTVKALWQRIFRALLIQSPQQLSNISRRMDEQADANKAKHQRLRKKKQSMQSTMNKSAEGGVTSDISIFRTVAPPSRRESLLPADDTDDQGVAEVREVMADIKAALRSIDTKFDRKFAAVQESQAALLSAIQQLQARARGAP